MENINDIVIKKDEIIKDIYNRLNNYDEILNKYNFQNIDELLKFIEKYNDHKCFLIDEIKDYIILKKEIYDINKVFTEQQQNILKYQLEGKIDSTLILINENKLLNDKINKLEYLQKIKVLEDKIKNLKIDDTISIEKEKDDKYKHQLNKYVQTKENNYLCPVYKNNKPSNIIEDMVSKETFINIKYYFEIYDNIKNTDSKKIEDIIIYNLSNKGMKTSSSTNKQHYRNILKRSWELYNKYKNKLIIINFNLTLMSRINENKWIEWLKYLDEIINN